VDLLDFLDHQIELAQYVIASPPALSHVSSGPTDPKMQPSPPFYSLERTFRTLKLNHDIISFVENLQDSDRSQETPPIITRPTNVVMVHRGPETLPRIFEVSSELSTLLDSMLSGELKNFIHPINQEIKNDLKAMGLLLSDESFFREH